jgi:hypothetical protein
LLFCEIAHLRYLSGETVSTGLFSGSLNISLRLFAGLPAVIRDALHLCGVSTPHLIDKISSTNCAQEDNTATERSLAHTDSLTILSMRTKGDFAIKFGVTGIHGIVLKFLSSSAKVFLLFPLIRFSHCVPSSL